jgi:hypothetical protein
VNTPTRVAAFGAGLVVAFGGALGVGRLADLGLPGADPASGHDSPVAATGPPHGHGAAPSASGSSTAGGSAGEAPATAATQAADLPGGLQVAQDGYRLVLDHPLAQASQDATLTFRILRPDNEPLLDYTTSHDKDLHLILVRRDLSGYAHVHPTLDVRGTWSIRTPLRPGAWRVLTDFDPAGPVPSMTLGADLVVDGQTRAVPLPAPATTAEVDGYTVTLRGALTPGRDSQLTLSVSRGGRPVPGLQPYLAAYGHLVVLRQGDLAYLHVHPDGEPGDGRTPAGPDVVFHTTAPSGGTYRLFLDFQHGGVVRTAELTVTAGQEVPGHGH